MYRIRGFIFRLKRAISWFVFSFKQNPWQEDYQLFETIEKVLLDTAKYFENREKSGTGVSVNNDNDIADMRLAAKLIRMKIDEHYWNIYMESQRNTESKNIHDFLKPTYRFKEALEAEKKDDRALKIAMNILAEKGFHWWI